MVHGKMSEALIQDCPRKIKRRGHPSSERALQGECGEEGSLQLSLARPLAGCRKTRIEGDTDGFEPYSHEPSTPIREGVAFHRVGPPMGHSLYCGTVAAHIEASTRLRIRTRL